MSAITPTQSNIMASLRSFLLAVFPGVDVIAGQINRVPEPSSSDFVVITPLHFERLRTNVDTEADVRFIGSIAGNTLTVTAVSFGVVLIGGTIFGTSVANGTVITGNGTGTGGIGTYTVSVSQSVSSETLSSGAQSFEQGAKVTVQMDFHSANDTDAGDMAQTVSTLLRDDFGFQQFLSQSPYYGVVPLYADDPRQVPFINEAQQIEWRWILEAQLQANQVVSQPQQYADVVTVNTIEVDATYPP